MKARRQALIREIVDTQSIQTQEELAQALREHGMVVTQATVSRDIKEMHLLKVLAEDGSYRYATMDKEEQGTSDRLIRIYMDVSNEEEVKRAAASRKSSTVPARPSASRYRFWTSSWINMTMSSARGLIRPSTTP